MEEMRNWQDKSETKKLLARYKVLDIAKKIPSEFRPSIDAYIENYWDCGWIRAMELLDKNEIIKLEKALFKIKHPEDKSVSRDEIRNGIKFPKETKIENEVPCEYNYEEVFYYEGEGWSLKPVYKFILNVNRYERTCHVENYDKEKGLLNSHLECYIDKNIIAQFFNAMRISKEFGQNQLDIKKASYKTYPTGIEIINSNFDNLNYMGKTISVYDVAKNADLIK